MVIKGSQVASICLLSLALCLSVAEYVMFTPRIDNAVMHTEEKDDSTETDDNVVENIVDEDIHQQQEVQPRETEDSDRMVTLTVSNGDTIASLLGRMNFSNNDIFNAIAALRKVFNLRGLRIGQQITICKHVENDVLILDKLELSVGTEIIIVARQSDGSYIATKKEIPVKKVLRSISVVVGKNGVIKNLIGNGLSANIARDAVYIMSQLVNVNVNGACVEILCFDVYSQNDNSYLRSELVYVAALVNGKIFKIYKFHDKNFSGYVQANGVIVEAKQNAGLHAPLSKMCISSKFGYRIHPITGVVRRHTGVDLRASHGTPVFAAGSGRVVHASYNYGYGKCVKIAHGNGLFTLYAHLSSIKVRVGQYVQTGYNIGAVGQTGRATGPHLHYEVQKHGIPVNPMHCITIERYKKIPTASVKSFEQFKKEVGMQVVGFTVSKNKQAKINAYS